MIAQLHQRWFAHRWWKAASVWLLVIANIVAECAPYLPEIQQALPGNWYVWAFRLILIARLLKQHEGKLRAQ